MPSVSSNGMVWKPIALMLISALIAGAASWLAFGATKIGRQEALEITTSHSIDREDAIRLIQTQSPYLEDRKLLNTTLRDMSATIKAQGIAMNALATSQAVQTKAIETMTDEQKRVCRNMDNAMKVLDNHIKSDHR